MSNHKQLILKTLPLLGQDDLRMIIESAKALLQDAPLAAEARHQERHTEMMWSALTDVFRERAKQQVSPYHVVKKGKLVVELRRAVDHIDLLLNEWLAPQRAQTVERFAFYKLFARLTFDWLRRANVPPSPTSLCRNADKFAGLVDNAFPGYVQAGQARLIVRLTRLTG